MFSRNSPPCRFRHIRRFLGPFYYRVRMRVRLCTVSLHPGSWGGALRPHVCGFTRLKQASLRYRVSIKCATENFVRLYIQKQSSKKTTNAKQTKKAAVQLHRADCGTHGTHTTPPVYCGQKTLLKRRRLMHATISTAVDFAFGFPTT